jgi:DNA replication protein DnaC
MAQSLAAPLLVRTSRSATGSASRLAERLCNVGTIARVWRQAHERADRTAGETDSESALHQGVDAQYVAGSTGLGKSWLGCAFAIQACRQGFSACYLRVPKLNEELAIAHGSGRYARWLAQLAKTDLVILDDLAMAPLTDSARRDLLEVLDDRHGHRSTLATSQIPVDHWHEAIGEPTVADAILDRLVHNAHRITLSGESLRKTRSRLTAKPQSE